MRPGELRGYVLAGGLSRRMGSDKAQLFHRSGVTQLEHISGILAEVTGRQATVLGPRDRYASFGLPVVEDLFPGSGPLAGIHAALSTTDCERNLIAAVDLPNLTADFLKQLVSYSISSPCVIVEGQPLCGIYHRSCLAIIEKALRESRRKVTTIVERELLAVTVVPPDSQLIENMNTIGDWQYHLNNHE